MFANRASQPLTPEDRATLLETLREMGGQNVVISLLVSTYANARNVSLVRARYVVRDVLDRGLIKTDKNFRLSLA